MEMGEAELAQIRVANAVQGVKDALVELRVAVRLMEECFGSCPRQLTGAGRVAAGPAEVLSLASAGPDDALVFPPEWQR